MSPALLTWTVWICAGLSPLWPWTVTGRYTGSPAIKYVKRAYAWATR